MKTECSLNTLLSSGGDKELEDHLKNHAKNASYLSPQIQNELIDFCGNSIKKKLLEDIKSASYFSIIVDEAADLARREQLSLVLRFVDAKRKKTLCTLM